MERGALTGEQVAAFVRASRAEQGLPERIIDPVVIEAVAAVLRANRLRPAS